MKRNQIPKTCDGCGAIFTKAPSMLHIRHCSRDCYTDFDRKWIPEPNSGCWLWLGAADAKGYGSVGIAGATRKAYRVSYERHVGKIPDGRQLDHKCRNPYCVNPQHLEPVTARVNSLRGSRPVRARSATHCINGHEWTAENTYWRPRQNRPSANRICRACNAASIRRYHERKRHA